MAAILLAPTLLIAAVSAASTDPRKAPEEPLLLFTDDSTIAVESRDPRLELRNHQPAKGPLVITPTVVDIFNQSSCCGPDSCVNDIPHEENVEERRAFFCSLHACCTGSPGQLSIEGHGLGALRRRTYR